MKTQELKIEAPEGYEIDWDNSSMNTIRFKPSKKKITYQDVKEKLFPESNVSFFLGHDGAIMQTFNIKYLSRELLLSTSIQQLEQIRALNKLMNVAKYLNGDWEPDWNNSSETKWGISFNGNQKKIDISVWGTQKYGNVYFKLEELVYQAIEILGEEEVKKALGIFE
jgi:hypothetical protein